jgi:hypothetical protein
MVQSRIVFFKAKQLFLSTKFTTGWTLFLLGSEQTKIMDLPPQKLPLRSFYIFISRHISPDSDASFLLLSSRGAPGCPAAAAPRSSQRRHPQVCPPPGAAATVA